MTMLRRKRKGKDRANAEAAEAAESNDGNEALASQGADQPRVSDDGAEPATDSGGVPASNVRLDSEPAPAARPGSQPAPAVQPGNEPSPNLRPGDQPLPVAWPGDRPSGRPGPNLRPGGRPTVPARPGNEPGPNLRPGGEPPLPARPASEPSPTVRPGGRPAPPAQPGSEPSSTARPNGQPAPAVQGADEPAPDAATGDEPAPSARPGGELARPSLASAGLPKRRWWLLLPVLVGGLVAMLVTVVGLFTSPGSPAAAPPAAASPTAAPGGHNVTVARVIDGDTVEVTGGFTATVQLLGIDASEFPGSGCWATESHGFAVSTLEGKSASLVNDPGQPAVDKRGRTLGYLRLADGSDYSVAAAAAGMATYHDNGQPVASAMEIKAAQSQAQKAKQGLWGPPCNGKIEAATEPSRASEPSRRPGTPTG